MSFLEQLKTEANYTRTTNGAKTHGSTGDACLDFFAVAGGMRYRKAAEQIRLYERAYIENPDLAMKLLFYIRDIRGGMGERNMFRTLIRHVAKTWPESAGKNVHLISKYGRFDDLWCLMDTSVQDEVICLVKEQLQKDLEAVERRENGECNAPVSLLAKWLPSCNTSSKKTRMQAQKLIRALGMDEKSYRKMLVKLRSHSCLTECYMTRKRVDKVKYETVPAGAMLKYRTAFERNDQKRFSGYLDEVSSGDKKIHCNTLFPYEIMRPYIEDGEQLPGNRVRLGIVDPAGMKVLENLWKHQDVLVAQKNAISVIDTSGSMYLREGNAPLPVTIAQSLGIRFAEYCRGPFHNHVITFESDPHLVELHGETLRDKIKYLSTVRFGFSTNLESVFDLILRTAIRANVSQDEMPAVLYIFSDMEFNQAVIDPNKTVYENAKAKFAAYGYELPAVVFHNVNSWQMQAPVTAHTKGTALTSGASTASFKHEFDGNVTPMSHMLKVLHSKRYEEVHA